MMLAFVRSLFLLALLLGGCRALPLAEPSPTPHLAPSATAAARPATATVAAVTERESPDGTPCTPSRHIPALRADAALPPDTLTLPRCYLLTLVMSEDAATFEAEATVWLRNQSNDTWPDLLFRLYPAAPLLFGGQLAVERVTVAGALAEARRELPDESALRVMLPTPLAPGEAVTVQLRFGGSLATTLSGDQFIYGIFARTEQAATMASWVPLLALWDAGSKQWQATPVLGEGDAVVSESALIEATLEAPSRFALATSGLVVEEEALGKRRRYHVVTGPARDLTLAWLDGYTQEERLVNGVTLRHWLVPGDEEGGRVAFDAAIEGFAQFDRHFGAYPFAELDIVEVPLAGAGGVEYPQLVLLDQGLYRNVGSHDFLAFASAHEVAHQWWYSTVGNNVLAHPWQDEALTNWSALFWLQQERPAEGVGWERSFEGSVARHEASSANDVSVGQPLSAFQNRGGDYGTLVYLKGALFFEAVRDQIGEAAFLDALQRYYQENLFALAPPAALLDSFEATSGQELDPLYAEWGVTR